MPEPDLRAFDELVDEMRESLAEIDDAELDPPALTFVHGLRAAIARYDADAEYELLDPRDADELGRGLGEVDGSGE